MFDDFTPKSGVAVTPPNLPIDEPEDMFANGPDSVELAEAPPSALETGLLKPKSTEPMTQTSAVSAPTVKTKFYTPPVSPSGEDVTPSAADGMYKIKEPVLSRTLITVVAILVITGVVSGMGWWVYSRFFVDRIESLPRENVGGTDSAPVVPTAAVQPVAETVLSGTDIVSSTEPQTTDDTILFGTVIDRDSDGLDDIRERELGTNPDHWDTDGDELTDYDEVVVWKTDPLRGDTDGDTHLDGREVKNGYSPTGPGRIFEPPTSASTTS